MKSRKAVTEVIKATNPNELKVYYAESMEDQIRFYINKTDYFSAIECEGGCKVEFDSHHEKTGKFLNNKKIRVLLVYVISNLILLAILLSICRKVNIIVMWIPVIDLLFTITNTLTIIILDLDTNNFKIRSKHSAEHMMINFLEQNKRLPQTVEEVRKCSRYSKNCGCRLLFDGAVEDVLEIIPATILMCLTLGVVTKIFHNSNIEYWTYPILYFLFKIAITPLVTKNRVFNKFANYIKLKLSYIVQYFATSDKVEDKDIIIAYYAAKPWLKVVYPEFYNFEEDTFWISEACDFLKVN